MSKVYTIEVCGAHLDPGEVCDCREGLLQQAYDLLVRLTPEQLDQLMEEWEKDTALGAANTKSGGVEQVVTGLNSTSIITEANG